MNGLDVYKTYQSIKLHFTTQKYNFFTYGGKTNISVDAFERRKDKFLFHKLARKYDEDEIVSFLVSNFVKNSNVWVRDLLTEDAEDTYRNWKKVTQSMSEIFRCDLDRLLVEKNPKEFNAIFVVTDGDSPILLQKLQQGDVTIESSVILNNMVNFIDRWDNQISDDIIYPKISMKIRKYGAFLTIDTKKYKNILLSLMHAI